MGERFEKLREMVEFMVRDILFGNPATSGRAENKAAMSVVSEYWEWIHNAADEEAKKIYSKESEGS